MSTSSPVLQQGTGIRRDRLGIITIRQKWVVDTLLETLTVGSGRLLGLPEDDRDFGEREDGRFEGTITYAGSQGDTPQDKEKWSGRIFYREEPIESLPGVERLVKLYEGSYDDQGKIVWPETLSSGSSSGTGLGGGGSKKTNPMFGAKTYPVVSGEVSHTYQRRVLPANLFKRLGKVIKSLPGNSGVQTPAGCVWVCQPPEWEGVGDCWQISDHYLLAKEEGYLAIVSKILGGAG